MSVHGTKHVCPECEAKYYDLNREVVTCPTCGAAPPPPRPVPAPRARGRRSSFGLRQPKMAATASS